MINNQERYQKILKPFTSLTTLELYEILQLRNQVFIVEQNCPFQDLDNKDFEAYHLLIYKDTELIAYSRLFPRGKIYEEASIGRVITAASARSQGIGKILMEESVQQIYRLFGKQTIKIGAQSYAVPFYEKLGFKTIGESYLEDNISHIHMIK